MLDFHLCSKNQGGVDWELRQLKKLVLKDQFIHFINFLFFIYFLKY